MGFILHMMGYSLLCNVSTLFFNIVTIAYLEKY